jgi:acylglycerol lipase
MQHTEGKFTGRNNYSLYRQAWLPDGVPIAVLLVVHGLAEHSGRYSNVVNYFVPGGYAVYSFDLRGHGKSEGKRGYVEHFSYYLDDLRTYYDIVRQENKNAKLFMVGHSIGATIATDFVINHPGKLDGLISSAVVLKAGDSVTGLTILMAKVLSLLFPKMGVSPIDASTISRDKAVVDAYVNDPLVYRGKISARLGTELLNEMKRLLSTISELSLPMLIMNGTADRLSNPASSKILFDGVSSKDKTLKLYEGFYHEIFNEPERQQVFLDMENWLKLHV